MTGKHDMRSESKAKGISPVSKRIYEPPAMIQLGELARGSGDCGPGISFLDMCGVGQIATLSCVSGDSYGL